MLPKPKKIFVAPKPKKPSLWSHINPAVAILRYRQPSIGPTMSKVIKSSSACIVAPVYAAVEQFNDWSTAIVDNIFEIANELHRITLQQLRLRTNSSYPISCVCPTFYLNYIEVSILVRSSPTSNPLLGGLTSIPENDQVQTMQDLLNENHGAILQCSGRTFAFWKCKDEFFAFVPEGLKGVGYCIPALLKSTDLRQVLEHSLRSVKGTCDLYSLKIISKKKIPKTLENLNKQFEVPVPRISTVSMDDGPTAEVQPEIPPPPAEAPTKPRKEKEKSKEVPTNQATIEDVILSFSSDFKELAENRGILVGKEYCKDPNRILHTITAAAVFQHHFPSNLWTSATIHDIMKLGKTIYNESEDDGILESEDWVDRIKFPIKFMKKQFSGLLEKLIFGRVTSEDSKIFSLDKGLMKFFEGNDVGLLIGPQIVLVWQQMNHYFMFDPKERDGLGRKWTWRFSAELGSTASAGSACVTWYRSPRKLAEVYVDTIPLKHRNDPYRIVRMCLFETPSKVEDEGEWIGSGNLWRLLGMKTICDYSYAEDALRGAKSLCIGVSALMHAVEKAEKDWKSATIDEVLKSGVELLKQSLVSHEAEKPFTLMSIKPIVEIENRRMRMNIVNCKIRGQMLAGRNDKGSVSLETGLSNFFNSSSYGVFTVEHIALGIWRGQDNYYYIFYPYEKLFGLPPQCLCATDQDLPPMGIAYATRFKTIADMFTFLTSCLNTNESDEYCLNPVIISLSDATTRPPLLQYVEFGIGGAILRPFKRLHEGHDMFGVRADKQTLANLLTALGFNRINSSTNWTKEDLFDILKIGDKIFCKTFMGLPECHSRDYQLQWDDVSLVIGMTKFIFTREPIEGVLEITPELMGEEFEQESVGEEGYHNEEGVQPHDDELFVPPQEDVIIEVTQKDLRGILQSWDEKKSDYHEAVVEADFFKIAIWKRDNLYFVFDPKACGEKGELTERRIEIGKDHAASDSFQLYKPHSDEPGDHGEHRKISQLPLFIEKRTYTHISNEGTAYTAWFSDFNEFYNHISMKTPETYQFGKFILHELVLKSSDISSDDLENHLKPGYRHIEPNHFILRGSITQNNSSLNNRNKQEFSNCLVAIAFAMITPSSKMTTTLLDVVLKYGDRLYTKSLTSKYAMPGFCETTKLTLDGILSTFTIYKIKFNWKLTATIRGNMNVNELRRAIGKLATIESGVAILLLHKGYLMAFWRAEGGYYLYDPFETNPSGWLAENGLPSLSKFGNLDGFLAYLAIKYVCVSGANTFIIHTIAISSGPVDDLHLAAINTEEDVEKLRIVSKIPKDQEVFHPYQDGMRILKSPLTPSKIPQHCLALAALVHSKLLFVELWNYNISHRISFLSRYLLQKTNCEMENPKCPISFDDIKSSFVIDNDILCHIMITKNMQGPIHNLKRTEIVGVNLKNALMKFFKNSHHVIIYMPGFGGVFALWKESGMFYLFGVNPTKTEMYVISSPILTNLYETLLEGTYSDTGVNNWYELRSVSITTVPINECICKPLETSKEAKEDPLSTIDMDYYNSADSKACDFYDHVSEKVERSLRNHVNKEFVNITENIEVLHSNDILVSHRFYGTKHFFACLQAACVEFSVLSRVRSPVLWTKKTLEKLLTGGVNLYINTVAVNGSSNIQMIDFKGIICVYDYKFEVNPLPPKAESANKEDLLLSLTWILNKYQTAYLYTENFCFTTILQENEYFLYYPGSSKMLCEDFRNDCSCLVRFCSLSELLDKLLENSEIALCENVLIGPINVCVKNVN